MLLSNLTNYAATMNKIANLYLEIGKQQHTIIGFEIDQHVITDPAWTLTVQQYGNFTSAQMDVEIILAALDSILYEYESTGCEKLFEEVDYRAYSRDHVALLAGLYNIKSKTKDTELYVEIELVIAQFEKKYPEALKGLDDLNDYLAD